MGLKVTLSGEQGCGKTRMAEAIIGMLVQRGYGYTREVEGKVFEERAATNGNPVVEIIEVQAR